MDKGDYFNPGGNSMPSWAVNDRAEPGPHKPRRGRVHFTSGGRFDEIGQRAKPYCISAEEALSAATTPVHAYQSMRTEASRCYFPRADTKITTTPSAGCPSREPATATLISWTNGLDIEPH